MEPQKGLNESLPRPEKVGSEVEKGAEAPARVESTPSQSKTPPLPQLPPDIPSANPVQLPVATDDSSTIASSEPEEKVAEKQWVERAKLIINQTKDDPFKQNHEVSKVKAEYVKKRFNKSIRTDTGTA